MPLKPIAPGQRKGNKNWLFRGRVAGKLREITTEFGPGTPTRVIREAAAKAERELWAELEASRIPRSGEDATFAQAARHYLAWKDPEEKRSWRQQRQRIDQLLLHLGDRLLKDITPADLTSLANDLMPNGKLASRNTTVIVPAAAILHYAARQNWCPHIRVQFFAIPKPRNRDVSDEVAETLINSLPEDCDKREYRRLLLLWLFRMGDRITDPLGVTWEGIDLQRQSVRMWHEKPDEEKTRPLHPEVFEALAAIPEDERTGYLFPWRDRDSVYWWLKPYAKSLGIHFTPHMARHTVGRQLNAAGVPLKTSMEVLGHKDVRSHLRYQNVDEASVRTALSALGKKR